MTVFLAGSSHMTLIQSPEHRHDHYEVILNINGDGIASIGDKSYPFSPGTIHILPPNTPHKKYASDGFQDIYFISDSSQFHNYHFLPDEPIVLHDDSESTLYKLMTILVSRFQKHKRYDPILESTHQIILQQLNEWYEKLSYDSVIDEVISHIENSFNYPDFTVTDALADTGYNVDYVRRRFQAITGTTPNNYLTEQRMKYALHLLWHQKQLNLSIGEIAAMSGYYDVCYFSRLFKKRMGISPTEYAAQYQKP